MIRDISGPFKLKHFGADQQFSTVILAHTLGLHVRVWHSFMIIGQPTNQTFWNLPVVTETGLWLLRDYGSLYVHRWCTQFTTFLQFWFSILNIPEYDFRFPLSSTMSTATCYNVNNCTDYTDPPQGRCKKTDECVCKDGFTGNISGRFYIIPGIQYYTKNRCI